jgi:hypothetical protein
MLTNKKPPTKKQKVFLINISINLEMPQIMFPFKNIIFNTIRF